jgi:replicative DNA helicase
VIDAAVISWCLKYNDINSVQRAGINELYFVDEYKTMWKYLRRMKAQHDSLPSIDTFSQRFPDFDQQKVRRAELPMLLDQIRKRWKFIEFMGRLNDVAGSGIDYENVDDKIQLLMGQLNTLAFTSRERSHMVDLFSEEARKRIMKDQKKRRSGLVAGIPTGLRRFDRENMGLQKQKMVVAIGRTGIGKSWMDLLFAAKAVQGGQKVVLYPLEMTLTETAYRLYSIFSQDMLGGSKVIKNLDLTRGHIPPKKLVRLLHLLEDKFHGQLYVADVGSLADPYTIERVEAEVEVLRPDMFWVDYITLLKAPPGSKQDGEHVMVRQLSNGIASVAKRRDCVGGCSAQVNREALKTRAFLPRLEHIAYGDSIGQDADQVFSLNRKGDYLFYALVKNRGGTEIPKMRMHFKPNEGILREDDIQEDPDDDD